MPTYDELAECMERAKEQLHQTAARSSTDQELRFEEAMGSDVAEARQTDTMAGTTFVEQMEDTGSQMSVVTKQCCAKSSDSSCDDTDDTMTSVSDNHHLSSRYSLVTNSSGMKESFWVREAEGILQSTAEAVGIDAPSLTSVPQGQSSGESW
jgi:hypothetical protein